LTGGVGIIPSPVRASFRSGRGRKSNKKKGVRKEMRTKEETW